jgi:hypothetical protein
MLRLKGDILTLLKGDITTLLLHRLKQEELHVIVEIVRKKYVVEKGHGYFLVLGKKY